MKIEITILYVCLFFGFIAKPTILFGTEKKDTIKPFFFIKQERITGIVFKGSQEREQLLTDYTRLDEELFTSTAKFQLGRRFWNLLDYKQEKFDFIFETGPFTGTGDWTDSSEVSYIIADRKIAGLRNNIGISYYKRSYFDYQNYTLVEISAWGRYDLFRQNTSGTFRDSNMISNDYDKIKYKDKLRYGFQAKAAWGLGRLNPVNHYMLSEYLLNKYYHRRVFSEKEILMVAEEIGQIKHKRDLKSERSSEEEINQLNEYLKSRLMLKFLEGADAEWQLGEFRPRFNGKRIEIGPFFNYYNREPDFVYGAYINMDYARYINFNWNTNISVTLNYSRYKKSDWVRDWILLEADLGWSFYANLKTQINFGLKYIPGMVVNEFTELEPVSHNFIPYLVYYTQANSKTRVDLAFAWIIADGKEFMQSGPELSLSIYRSRY